MKSDEAASALRDAAGGVDGIALQVHVSEGEDPWRDDAVRSDHDVLVVDIEAGNESEAERLARFIRDRHASRPVIVTAAAAGVADIQRMMGTGAVDVLSQPIREIDLLVALDHASRCQVEQSPTPARKGKVISFLKGGGGVGSTTLAVQGGGLLAAGGKKGAPKVCLLDLDIQFGTAGLYLDLKNTVGLADLLESPERIDVSFLSSAMTRHESGLDVLMAPAQVLPLESVWPDFVANLLDFACQAYDYVLLDLPQSWTSWTYTALRHSDAIVLVTELTVSGVRQAAHQINTIREQELHDVPVHYVLNRYRRSVLGGLTQVSDAEKGLNHRFDHRIANNYELVSEAINQGVLLNRVQRRSKTEKQIGEMMETILQKLAAKERPVRSFLSH